MLQPVINPQTTTVAATTALIGMAQAHRAFRRACDESWGARAVVAAVAFVLAALVLFGYVAPAVAYALACLSLVSIYIADLFLEERMRRRRVALLAPRPRADRIQAVWTTLAALSALMVIPFATDAGHRSAAIVVAACVITMAAVAWRIASAPLQLSGEEEPATERAAERRSRARRTGLTAIIACGTVMVFVNFVSPMSGSATPVQQAAQNIAGPLWFGLMLWVAVYVWLLSRSRIKVAS